MRKIRILNSEDMNVFYNENEDIRYYPLMNVRTKGFSHIHGTLW